MTTEATTATTTQLPPTYINKKGEACTIQDRAGQINEIRLQLSHPRDAYDTLSDGTVVWKKAPKPVMANLEVILSKDPVFSTRLRRNEFTAVVEWEGEPLKDTTVTMLQIAVARCYKVHFAESTLFRGIQLVAERQGYHPVQEWLRMLKWDRVPRIDKMLSTYAGAKDTPLHRAIARRFMISAVARVMRQPTKVDTVLILQGAQGAGKSTFFKVLASPEWFSDTTLDIRNKDSYQALRGVWLYELAELAATRPRDAETVKAFLAAQTDRFRPPYGREMVTLHRQNVFVGTTNEESFLADPTGARRFWPVRVHGGVQSAKLLADREQLWAEAFEAHKDAETWWLTPEEDDMLREAQEVFAHVDPWESKISDWLSGRHGLAAKEGLQVSDILGRALEMDPKDQGKHHEMRAGGILQRLGFTKKRVRRGGKKRVRWFRPSTTSGVDETQRHFGENADW